MHTFWSRKGLNLPTMDCISLFRTALLCNRNVHRLYTMNGIVLLTQIELPYKNFKIVIIEFILYLLEMSNEELNNFLDYCFQ